MKKYILLIILMTVSLSTHSETDYESFSPPAMNDISWHINMCREAVIFTITLFMMEEKYGPDVVTEQGESLITQERVDRFFDRQNQKILSHTDIRYALSLGLAIQQAMIAKEMAARGPAMIDGAMSECASALAKQMKEFPR